MTAFIPPATASELANPAPAGQGRRHLQALKIACSLAGNGHRADEIATKLAVTDLPGQEIQDIADWATKQGFSPSKPSNQSAIGNYRQPKGNQRKNTDRTEYAPADCQWNASSLLAGYSASPRDVGSASPTPITTEPITSATSFLSSLYSPGEQLNIVVFANAEGKPANRGETLTVTEWLTRFQSGIPSGSNGAWLRPNPMTGTGINDKDVAAYRFCLVESDHLTLAQQGALAMKLKELLPIVAIVASGGKSLHIWIAVNAGGYEEYHQRVVELLTLLEPFGVDQSNKNPSRLSRLPGATRNGVPQALLYLDPGAKTRHLDLTALRSMLATVSTIKTVPKVESEPSEPAESALPPALTLDQFSHGVDNGGSLLGNRYLCRGGGLLLAAPTGIGKSSWSLQAAVSWSLGLPHLGIRPSGQLRSLFVQAENDDGDIAELRDGVYAGLQLTTEQITAVSSQVKIVSETSKTSGEFVEMVGRLVALHQPHLVWVDPLFSFLGADVCDQAAVSTFLRNGLNPILQKHGCGLVLVHHTNKPQKGSEKSDWKAGDFAYLGSGTAELANWARAVIGIRSVGEHDVFEMVLGKRGKRAGLVDEWSNPVYSVYIRHSQTGICWERGDAPAGKRVFTKADVLNLIPVTGTISQTKVFNNANDLGIGEKRVRNWLKELEEDGQVFPVLTPRPGTNPAKSYSRQRPAGDFGAETLAGKNDPPKSLLG